jgi:hypothetical protein
VDAVAGDAVNAVAGMWRHLIALLWCPAELKTIFLKSESHYLCFGYYGIYHTRYLVCIFKLANLYCVREELQTVTGIESHGFLLKTVSVRPEMHQNAL